MTTEKKLPNRPPFTVYFIEELIKVGNIAEAQNCADACEIYFAAKRTQMQALFIKAEKAKRGYST